jgi:protein-L-isoaspartate(D-aspartate) O-methyltransferase
VESNDKLREAFVAELAVHGGLTSASLLRAFAKVPREQLLPPGPWIIESADASYYATEDDNIAHVLHAVGVAIDTKRDLISANPAKIGRMLEATRIAPGETVLHVGAGLGYFSAVMAELVGPEGHVIASEIDSDLADRARSNLAAWRNVDVIGDSLAGSLPPLDVVFASAGSAGIPRQWTDALREGGRMVLPMTGALDSGFLFHFEKSASPDWFFAWVQSFVRFFPCHGMRDPAAVRDLSKALGDTRGPSVCGLRLDHHDHEPQCWLHGEDWCLTTKRPPNETSAGFVTAMARLRGHRHGQAK